MSNPSCALDPSVGDDADTSPAKLGRRIRVARTGTNERRCYKLLRASAAPSARARSLP